MTLQPAAELLGAPGVGEPGALDAPAIIPAIADAPASDELLLARFLKGERDALGALAMRHESQLLGLACGLTGRRDLALEAVQETWLKVIKYGRSFKSGSTVKTWLYRILINNCKDARARNYRLGGTGSLLGGPASDVGTRTSDLSDSPDLAQVRSAVNHLSGDQKLLILLCYHNGLTHPQAAEVLNIPVGTLKSRLHTILNTLRTHLATS